MFGPGMIRSMNNVATIDGLLRKQESFLYEVDEIVTEIAYERGWSQSDQGEWTDEDGDRADHPLDMFLHMHLSDDMEDAIVEKALAAYKREYTDTEDDE
jgi:hypothetical protein